MQKVWRATRLAVHVYWVKGDSANFFKGGELSASPFNVGSFSSTLRFVPTRFDGVGDCDGDLELLNVARGGVIRETDVSPLDNDASGVPDRLPLVAVRNRAARLLVDVIASA
jgi:hypothetical protein